MPSFLIGLCVDDSTVNSGLLARIGYNGKWTTGNVPGPYGESVRHSRTGRDKAQLNKIEFTVNGNFAWVFTLGPGRGLASVSVGMSSVTAEQYAKEE